MTRHFTALCLKCNGLVRGSDDWNKYDICIMGTCDKCGEDYMEDDLDWVENKEE